MPYSIWTMKGGQTLYLVAVEQLTGFCFTQSLLVGTGQLGRDATFISNRPAIYVQINSDTLLVTSTTSLP